jgi:hypothetical protein
MPRHGRGIFLFPANTPRFNSTQLIAIRSSLRATVSDANRRESTGFQPQKLTGKPNSERQFQAPDWRSIFCAQF